MKKRYNRKGQWIIVMVLTGFLGACNGMPGHNVPIWKYWIFDGPPPGKEYTPLYVEGWKHGCETGASAVANHFYKFKYKFRQDWKLAQNRVYYKGWRDAFDYCQRYVYMHNTSSFP